MSRFIFYLILINMMTSMVSLTPRILIAGSGSGTILSLVLALIVGIVMTYILVSLFQPLPGTRLARNFGSVRSQMVCKTDPPFLSGLPGMPQVSLHLPFIQLSLFVF